MDSLKSTYLILELNKWKKKDCCSIFQFTNIFFRVEADRCRPNPCRHGGVCVTHGLSAYECHCPAGFTGTDCEVEAMIGMIHKCLVIWIE